MASSSHRASSDAGDFATIQALTTVATSAHNARHAIARVNPAAPPDDVYARLSSAAAELELLRASVGDTLRYSLPVPCAVPGDPSHTPIFLRISKEGEALAADANAEAVGASLVGADAAAYNAALRKLLDAYAVEAQRVLSGGGREHT